MTEAWDRGDAEAYARCFTPDASYVTFVGTTYLGRQDIAECHRALFAKFGKGTRMRMEILSLGHPAPTTITVVSSGDVTKKPPRRLAKMQTFTFTRDDDGEWLCAAFQNTKHHPLMERVSFLFDERFRPLRERRRA